MQHSAKRSGVISRRQFVQAGGLACVTSLSGLVTPAVAFAQKLAHQVLSDAEVAALERLSESIVPGSREAGISHYIDSQLHAAPDKTLLMLKYLVPPPHAGFYQASLASVTSLYAAQPDADEAAIVGQIATGEAAGWQGPPAPFFYFVLRSDACDVVYGTEEGSQRLGLPYRAHILPNSNW